MGLESYSLSSAEIRHSGVFVPAWGKFGVGSRSDPPGEHERLLRCQLKADSAGANRIDFRITGAAARRFDESAGAWTEQGVTLAALAPRFWLSSGANPDSSAQTQNSTVSGSTVSGSLRTRIRPGETRYLFLRVAAGAVGAVDGSLSVTLSGSGKSPAVLRAADGSFGQTVSLRLTGMETGAKTTVTALCAGRSETLQTKSADSLLSWTPDAAVYGPLLPGSASAPVRFQVRTFYGADETDETESACTLSFRETDAAPLAEEGWVTASPYNAGAAAAVDRYIQGLSRAELHFDASKLRTRLGATLSGFRLLCPGGTVSAAPYRSGLLTGETELTARAVDSRGFTVSQTLRVTPLPYAPPTVLSPSAERCLADGTADEGGTCCLARGTALYSPLDGENSASLTAALRPVGGSFGAEQSVPAEGLLLTGLDADLSYELRLRVTDRVGGEGQTLLQLPRQSWAMKFRPGGRGVAFGMAPEADKLLQIPEDWDLRRGSRSLFPRQVTLTKAADFSPEGYTFIARADVMGYLGMLYFNLSVPAMGAAEKLACTLPAGFRPAQKQNYTLCGQKGGIYLLQLYTDGRLTLYGAANTSAAQFFRGSICFPAA